MNPNDAFAPPKSSVADVADDADIGSAKPRIPTLFKVLLVGFFVLQLLGVLIGLSAGGIVWIGVMAIAAGRTLQGSYPASRVLGVFLILNAALVLVAATGAFQHSAFGGGVLAAMAVYMGVLAAYIFLDKSMQAVFRRAASKKWSGG